MRRLTIEEWPSYHRRVLSALAALAQNVEGVRTHPAGLEYTSLMSSFLMHNVSCARSLLALYESSGVEWFPVTVGYVIARSMFEVDVAAHYISRAPGERARRYILFEHVLDHKAMLACDRHRKSADASWREATDIEWKEKWEGREHAVKDKFAEVAPLFTVAVGKRKGRTFDNWSGTSLRNMAREVGHEEAYDSFYAELSSFTHADVRMANRFLRLRPDGTSWTQCADARDVGEVLHHASSFLTCYLKHFGSQFDVLDDAAVEACWDSSEAQCLGRPSSML